MNDKYYPRVPREEKTDWKSDVRRALVFPSFARSPWEFKHRVQSAISIISNTYPNWEVVIQAAEFPG